jgi:hypothetical protein
MRGLSYAQETMNPTDAAGHCGFTVGLAMLAHDARNQALIPGV